MMEIRRGHERNKRRDDHGADGRRSCLRGLFEREDLRSALGEGDWATTLATVIRVAGVSQNDIAIATGISQPHISRLVNGQSREPSVRTIRALCDGLGIPRTLVGLADGEVIATDRRRLLGDSLAVAGMAAVAPARLSGGVQADVQALRLPVAAYRRMEQRTPARLLLGSACAHLALVRAMAERVGGADRSSVDAVFSEAAGVVAWLHADLDEAVSARRCYRMAVGAADRAGHALLPTYMQASLGQFAVTVGDVGPGLALIRRARNRLRGSVPKIARCWLDVMEGVAMAAAGDREGLALIDSADRRMAAGREEDPCWPWMFRFDAPKIAGYRAAAAGFLGLTSVAESAYRSAAMPGSPKQRAFAAASHATALARGGRLEEACALACRAFDTGREFGSERTIAEVRRFRSRLGRRAGSSTQGLDRRLVAAYGGEA